jgi:hypothetical protein
MARGWVPSGVDQSPLGLAGGATALAPTLVAGPTINVALGGCWLDGHYAELTAPAAIPASANGLLVVRFTPSDNHAELLYRDAAALPPTQTLATWELAIASMAAGVIADRRIGWRAGSPPVFPNYATLKALYPTAPDGFQATTLDDGRTYTFRAAAYTDPVTSIAAPSNRWETSVWKAFLKATDAGGLLNVGMTECGLDGFLSCVGHAGWDSAASPNTFFGAIGRLNSMTTFSYKLWNVTGAGALALKVSSAQVTVTIWAYGWRV